MSAKALIVILSLVAQSAIYTDSLQTQHCIKGTWDNPVRSPNRYAVYEGNPILAGRPEMREPYFRFLGDITELIPQYLKPPWDVFILGGWGLAAMANVIENNETAQQVGFPQYWGLSYRWRF